MMLRHYTRATKMYTFLCGRIERLHLFQPLKQTSVREERLKNKKCYLALIQRTLKRKYKEGSLFWFFLLKSNMEQRRSLYQS